MSCLEKSIINNFVCSFPLLVLLGMVEMGEGGWGGGGREREGGREL